MDSTKDEIPSSKEAMSLSRPWPARICGDGHLGLLPETKFINQHVILLPDWYTKLIRATAVTTVASMNATTMFVDNWVILCGIPTNLWTDKEWQLVLKFFLTAFVTLGVKHLTTTAYSFQTFSKVRRFNRTIVAHLQRYVAEQQINWYRCIEALTNAYNAELHWLTCTKPLGLVLTFQPPGPALLDPASARPHDMTETRGPVYLRTRFLRKLDVLCKRVDARCETVPGR